MKVGAARQLQQAAKVAQGTVEGKRTSVEMISSSLDSQKLLLAAELKKAQPDPKVVSALRTSIGKLTPSLETARAELKAAVADATAATKASTDANVKELQVDAKTVGQGAKLEKDEFDANARAKGFGVLDDVTKLGTKGLEQLAKALQKKAHDTTLPKADRSAAKAQLAVVRDSVKKLKSAERSFDQLEHKATRDAAKAHRAAKKLEPELTAAKERLRQEVEAIVGGNVGNLVGAVKAGQADARAAQATTGAALVDHVATTVNADRAMKASAQIDTVAASSAEAGKRLTPELREMLVRGVADPRTQDVNGREGVLGRSQATKAAVALATMPAAQYEKISAALSAASSPAEQALILKAVAARAETFVTPANSFTAGKLLDAQDQVLGFAKDIRGMPRDQLIAATTVIDVDASKNTSAINPNDLTHPGNDQIKNNDGLFQHLTMSCAPTTGQMMLAESEPVFALSLTKDGLGRIDSNGVVTKGQQESLDAHGGSAIHRDDEQRVLFHRNAMIGDAKGRKLMSSPEMESLWKHLNGQSMSWIEAKLAATGLEKMRNGNSGWPSDAEVAEMQRLSQTPSRGTNAPRVIGDMNGVKLTETHTYGTYNAAMVYAALPRVADKLADGVDVPMGIQSENAGHVVLMTDVRGSGKSQEFLISDPATGRTDWVSARELAEDPKGWMKRFDLHHQQVSGFVM